MKNVMDITFLSLSLSQTHTHTHFSYDKKIFFYDKKIFFFIGKYLGLINTITMKEITLLVKLWMPFSTWEL